MNLSSTVQKYNFSINLTELYKAKLDETQIVVFGISSVFSVYLFFCTVNYTVARWKDKLRFDNCCCLITTLFTLLAFSTVLCRIVLWRDYLSTCKFLHTSLFTNVTLSRCSAHLVFRSRYNTMYRSINKQKTALFYTILVIVASMLQLLVCYLTAFWLGNPKLCISGLPNKTSLYLLSFLFFIIIIVQTIMIIMTIMPVLQYFRSLDKNKSEISSAHMINVLKRLFLTLLSFVLSDILLVVSSLVFARINTWLPIFTVVNMNINSMSIIFSFSDFKQRMMPLTTKEN